MCNLESILFLLPEYLNIMAITEPGLILRLIHSQRNVASVSDHSWINCQSALTAVETSDGVCVAHVHCVNTNEDAQEPFLLE